MSGITGILTAFGLSSSAGLNAYLPLLVVGLAATLVELSAIDFARLCHSRAGLAVLIPIVSFR